MPHEIDRQTAYGQLVGMLRGNTILSRLSDEQINQLALRANFEGYRSGETIFHQDEPASSFYFILKGQVRVIDTSHQPARLVTYLHAGDFFGERSLLFDAPRSTTVDVVVDTDMATFDKQTWLWLLSLSPDIENGFKNLEERYTTRAQLDFPGRQFNEIVIRNDNRHILALIAKLSGPILLLVLGIVLQILLDDLDLLGFNALNITTLLLFVIAVPWTVYLYADWVNDDFIITTERVVHIERTIIYGESREEAPLSQIQDVSVSTPNFFTRFFGYYNVVIKTAGAGNILFDGIQDGDILKEAIFEQRQKATERIEASDVAAIRKSLVDRMGWNVGPVEASTLVAAGARPQRKELDLPGIIKYFIPKVREEMGDTITWRKHYIILLQHIILPLIASFIAFYLFLAALVGFVPFLGPDPLVLLFLLVWLFTLLWYTYEYDGWHKDVYIVTRTVIIDQESTAFRLRGEKRRQGTFDVIQNTTYKTPSFITRVLNMGDVIIETAGTADTFTFKQVYNPKEVQQEIFKRWISFKQGQRQKDRSAEERRFTRWFKEYHDLIQEAEE